MKCRYWISRIITEVNYELEGKQSDYLRNDNMMYERKTFAGSWSNDHINELHKWLENYCGYGKTYEGDFKIHEVCKDQ